ncbi:hypothetical protein ACJX0J_029014, partial [Zea mays]
HFLTKPLAKSNLYNVGSKGLVTDTSSSTASLLVVFNITVYVLKRDIEVSGGNPKGRNDRWASYGQDGVHTSVVRINTVKLFSLAMLNILLLIVILI